MLLETLYRARVDHEGDARGEIETEAFSLAGELNVESFIGCPACGPYIEAEGSNPQEVVEWAEAVESFIRNFSRPETCDHESR